MGSLCRCPPCAFQTPGRGFQKHLLEFKASYPFVFRVFPPPAPTGGFLHRGFCASGLLSGEVVLNPTTLSAGLGEGPPPHLQSSQRWTETLVRPLGRQGSETGCSGGTGRRVLASRVGAHVSRLQPSVLESQAPGHRLGSTLGTDVGDPLPGWPLSLLRPPQRGRDPEEQFSLLTSKPQKQRKQTLVGRTRQKGSRYPFQHS